MVVGEIARGGRQAKVIICGQKNAVHFKALLPRALILEIRGHDQLIVLISDGNDGVVFDVAQLYLTARQLGVSPIPVVVVVLNVI